VHGETAASRLTWVGRVRAALARDPEPVVAALVGALTLALLASTAGAGIVRDEGYYFRAAREYHAWFEALLPRLAAGHLGEAFGDAALKQAFGYNTEHPGLMKLLMGFTWKVAHGWLGLSSRLGFRLAAMLVVSLGAAVTHLFGARLYGRAVGLLAVALYLACPHVFYHAHLAAFDAPVTALIVVTTYAFWRGLESRRWAVLTGLAFGLALATKHNAVFLLPTLTLAFVGSRFRQLRTGVARRVPLALVAMVVLGPLVLYATYPFGWHAPLERLGAYYAYHLRHEHYPVDYLGTLYRSPPFPWSFPWVMTALTVPLPTLVAGLAGVVLVVRDLVQPASPRRDAAWILLPALLVPPFVISLPSVPIFGGVKHWLPMMPFFTLLAARAVVTAGVTLRSVVTGRRGVALAWALAGAMVLLPALETARSQPLGHTYYNELALGAPGAAALGMPRGFWGGAGGALLPVLDRLAQPGDTVFSHRMNAYSFSAYQGDGLLRADLAWTGDLSRARWALIYHQREHQDAEYAAWLRALDRRPAASVVIDGVPIVSLYRLGAAADPSPMFRPPPPSGGAAAQEEGR
jgi:4-amino-4-deoxy-L-arabinose transferase-like glycosyltransferase